ncbi:MFS transporter [Cellvibrio japonicus]|uniref:AmpG protein, beta-lactamase induction signal transducer n=1 Tax=Cellvibrio japonicus (strain Ueda107) TaxID=498211 RepID=B3PIA2_CELJU|nr:MFS transporter [Cellvibrio japonicus]ACE85440.1 AmpG protein, beta-lactamase induction signal transducer [Cellvibrio japonicus Ueda107]QEI11144.1 AmpG family muropeptide MFS transporter [Cellvibrio japonicus]QEI14718.1 AmpG family muropeptide MFS transporter [Cellvibrio japonicus]QEI18298.1 AmpG family muropeptide MFS transporter [Cellvibrio japonicus]
MHSAPATRHPLLWVPSGYFTMALTYNMLTAAAVIMFSNLGMDNGEAAAYASALGLAYTIKPFFAAFLEMYKTKKFFVLLSQILLGVGFIGVSLVMNLPNYIPLMLAFFWVLSFIGSSQDITTDGVYVTSLDAKSQALFCGWQSLSWNLGKLAMMSVMVMLSGFLHEHYFGNDPHASGPEWINSWQLVFLMMGIIMLVMALWHWRVMPDGARAENTPRTPGEAISTLVDAFVTFFQKQGIWLMIGFALLFRISFGFLNAPSMLFMKDSLENGGLSLTNQEFGLIYGTFGLIALLVGSLIGGAYVAKKGLQKALFPLCCCVNIPNITFLLMAFYQPDSHVLISLGVVIEQFFFGIGSVGFMIYLMQQLAPGKYATTHYAFGTALMGLCMMLTGMVSGHLQVAMGYVGYFVFVMLATIPSFLICWFAPFPHKHD